MIAQASALRAGLQVAPPVFALPGKPQGRKRMESLRRKIEGST